MEIKSTALIEHSIITCPHCGTASLQRMQVDACRFFHTCSGCGVRLKPKPGDCCVFCSFGSVPCPPVQVNGKSSIGCGCVRDGQT